MGGICFETVKQAIFYTLKTKIYTFRTLLTSACHASSSNGNGKWGSGIWQPWLVCIKHPYSRITLNAQNEEKLCSLVNKIFQLFRWVTTLQIKFLPFKCLRLRSSREALTAPPSGRDERPYGSEANRRKSAVTLGFLPRIRVHHQVSAVFLLFFSKQQNFMVSRIHNQDLNYFIACMTRISPHTVNYHIKGSNHKKGH